MGDSGKNLRNTPSRTSENALLEQGLKVKVAIIIDPCAQKEN